MNLSRRDFLQYCSTAAAALGLSAGQYHRLQAALTSNKAPTLLWLHGSGCQGDSISLLNLYTSMAPVGDLKLDTLLSDHVNLAYSTVLMATAGPDAVNILKQAENHGGGYVLVLEGAVPTAFNGHTCVVYSDETGPVTYQQAIERLAPAANTVLCVGTCACYGGVVASGPDAFENNPTDVIPVPSLIQRLAPEKPIINIPGCPAHPDWIVWAIVQLILGEFPGLDQDLRPTALFGNQNHDLETLNVHHNCPRREKDPGDQRYAKQFGEDHLCLEHLGCRGPNTYADCPLRQWNHGPAGPTNWCVDSNGMCLGCVEPDFPGNTFYS